MRLVRFFRRKHWDSERAAELESHLQIETDRNIEAGMSPADARAAAYRKLGNPYRIRETIYEINTIPLLDTLWRDLRFSLRTLIKRPGFTVVVVRILGPDLRFIFVPSETRTLLNRASEVLRSR